MIVYYGGNSTIKKENEDSLKDNEEKPIKKNPVPNPVILKYYYIFNLQQTDYQLPENDIPYVPRTILCESIIEDWKNKPRIITGGDSAFYSVSKDIIKIPDISNFNSSEEYYSTLFHEAIHSTAHSNRLNRKEIIATSNSGNTAYGIEELIAEIGSSFLCDKAGISNAVIDNQASYISHWLKSLQNDKTLIIKSANKAQKAVDYILNEVSYE